MKTDTQNRAAEISAALLPAYQNASKLKITKAEAKRLTKSFPDDVVEIRPNDGAIWIPHIYISQRLNEVFGPGSWSLICREHYIDEEAAMLYAEHILVVRGCFVGEAVGEHHFEIGERAKYGDALESSAAEALRRICGKRLSCGNQVWQPTYCQKWQKKHAEMFAGEINVGRDIQKTMLWRKKGAKGTVDTLSEAYLPKGRRGRADDNMRHIMLQILCTAGKDNVLQFAIAKKILKKGQTLDDWPLDRVVTTESDIRALQLEIQEFFAPKEAVAGDWKNFRIPFGGMKGDKLGDVPKEVVSGYWEAFHPSSKVVPQVKGCDDFKAALDAAAKFYGFQKMKGSK